MAAWNPAALLEALLAFYPIVSAEELARAWRERPDLFAGGVIFGSKGDKLRLPDGTEWDLIVAAGGPAAGRRWQVSFIDPAAAGAGAGFELEAGPLTPIADDAAPRRDPDTFSNLVARELLELGNWQDAYDHARTTAIDTGASFADLGDDPDLLEGAAQLQSDSTHRRALQPVDEINATNGLSPTIDDRFGEVGSDPDAAAASEVGTPDWPPRGKNPDGTDDPTPPPHGGH